MIKILCFFLCFGSVFTRNIDDEKIDLSHFDSALFGEPIESNVMNRARRFGNPEEHGPYLEGDLLMPTGRNGVKLESQRWRNGEVPYEIRGSFSECLIGFSK
jgi:hypothetical protein